MSHAGSWKVFLGHIVILAAQLWELTCLIMSYASITQLMPDVIFDEKSCVVDRTVPFGALGISLAFAMFTLLGCHLGAVHKLCRFKGGGGGVKNCQFYLVKRRLRRGEGVKNCQF